MPENDVGNAGSPWHGLPCTECKSDVFQIEFARIVCDVTWGHVGIKEGHGLAFFCAHFLAEHVEKIAVRQCCLFGLEVILHPCPVFFVFQKVTGSAGE